MSNQTLLMRKKLKETNLLSGKVRSGICGYMMQPNADKQRKYQCRRAKYAEAGACFTGGISKKLIEDAVLASIRVLAETLIEKDSQMREAKAMKPEVVSLNNMEQFRVLKKSMDSIKKNKMLFYDQYCDEHISKAEYMEQRNSCGTLLRELEEQAVAIEKEMLANEYLQHEKLAEATDGQYGKENAEYIAKPIRHYYGKL